MSQTSMHDERFLQDCDLVHEEKDHWGPATLSPEDALELEQWLDSLPPSIPTPEDFPVPPDAGPVGEIEPPW